MTRRLLRIFIISTLLLACSNGGESLLAQTKSQKPSKTNPEEAETLRINTALVTLSAGVTDKQGRPVSNLTRESFAVYEDGRLQPIEFFGQEDLPISFGLLLDRSQSMGETGKLENAKTVALSFLRAGNPQNEAFCLAFNEAPALVADFTSDYPQIEAKLAQIGRDGGTALYDAIIEGLERLARARHRRRALVVITDGRDEHSRHSLADLIRRAQQSDAQIYTIGFFSPVETEAYRTGKPTVTMADGKEVENPRFVFRTLAAQTGAETFFPKSAKEMAGAIAQIAASLRRQYTLAYYPANQSSDDSYRKITVKLIGERGDQWRVQTRQGYRLSEPLSAAPAATAASEKPETAANRIAVVIAPRFNTERVEEIGPPLYRETFDSPSANWPQEETAYLKKGKLYLTGERVIAATPFVYADFEASVNVEVIGGPKDAGRRSSPGLTDAGTLTAAGLSFRINQDGYYTLMVAPLPNGKEGLYKLLKVSGGKQTDLINWRKDSAITFRNRIKVRCAGSRIEIFINLLRIYAVNDGAHKEGRLNLVLSDGHVTFDDLVIKKLD
jgi:Ca-activated chloride channel family protein